MAMKDSNTYKDVYLHTDSAKQGNSFQIMTGKKYAKLHLELAVTGGAQEIVIMDHNNSTLKKCPWLLKMAWSA